MVDTAHLFTITTYMKYATIPSTVILVILALLQRRARPNRCGYHYPALVVPMRFLDGYDDRWAYALSFAAIAGILVSVFLQISLGTNDKSSDPATQYGDTLFCGPDPASSTLCSEVWVKTLLLQAQSLVASLVCAPHFVCITTPYKLIGALLGFAYSVYWVVFYIVGAVRNEQDYDTTVGTLLLLRDIPVILCFFGLCLRSVWTIYKCYKNKTIRVRVVDHVVEQHQVNHVMSLFRPPPDDPIPPEGLVQKIKVKVKSLLLPHFKVPTRIICIAFVQVIVIYYMGVTFSEIGVFLRRSFKEVMQQTSLTFNVSMTDKRLRTTLDIFDGVYVTSETIGLMATAIYIVLFVVNYRINMVNIYKGKKHTLYQEAESRSNSMHVASSLRLPGYQIAYILWGFIIILIALLFVVGVISFGLYGLYLAGLLEALFKYLAQILSVPVLTIVIFYVQVFLVRMFLLQPKVNTDDKEPPLNVDNRRLYEVVAYTLVFSNLMVGLASALFRTLKSFLLGVIFLGRLDRCLLMKGFENLDPGYMAYVDTLLVDNAHNNPVMRTFCAVLFRLTCKQVDKVDKGITYLWEPEKTCSNSPAARRWHLAYTLLKNPDLLSRRKLALLLTRTIADDDDVENNDNDSRNRSISSTNGNESKAPVDPRSGAFSAEVDFYPMSRKVPHLGNCAVEGERNGAYATELSSRFRSGGGSYGSLDSAETEPVSVDTEKGFGGSKSWI